MFSVSGWSVSAPLRAQTETISSASATAESHSKSTPPSNSKKRKRGHGQSKEPLVTTNNVAELWQRHIDGVTGSDAGGALSHTKKEKQQKRKRLSEGESDQIRSDKVTHDSRQTRVEQNSSSLAGEDRGHLKLKMEKKNKKSKPQKDHKQPSDNHHKSSLFRNDPTSETPKLSVDGVNKTANENSQKSSARASQHLHTASNGAGLTPLQASMRAKLSSARFRHLNETLYTSPSSKALDLFTKNPELYNEYHSGFRQQVEVWPENPVDGYIVDIKSRGSIKFNKKGEVKGHKREQVQEGTRQLPRTQGTCTIADLGCGDARLAQALVPGQQKLQIKVLSFDLHSDSLHVQKADISSLPLADGSINIAIFCLALMGLNWPDFIDEAWRILHWKGELWVAEIKSRFGRVQNQKGKVVDHSVGKKKKPRSKMTDMEKKKADETQREEDDTLAVEVDGAENHKGETDVSTFIQVLAKRGFVLDGGESEAVDLRNRMFVKMRFIKAVAPSKGKNVQVQSDGTTWTPKMKKKFVEEKDQIDEDKVLKPCVYKLR